MSSIFRSNRLHLFSTDLEPACSYCEFGTPTQDGAAILCTRCGVMTPAFSCKKFRYDPISRSVRPHLPPTGYTEEDFRL